MKKNVGFDSTIKKYAIISSVHILKDQESEKLLAQICLKLSYESHNLCYLFQIYHYFLLHL